MNRRGFTLVELLIVIVVIAILAALTLVAYGGMQSRAQLAKLQSDAHSASVELEIFKGQNAGSYPASISDCPTPAAGNDCITLGSEAVSYQAFNTGAITYVTLPHPGYQLTLLDQSQGLITSNLEFVGNNEFARTIDIAPLIDKYGLKKYDVSFDIKSANIASKSTVNVYMQNGSGARYGGLSVNVPVTTTFTHQDLTFTASNSNMSLTQSYLSFYGTYSTGNIPTIQNIQVSVVQ